MEGGGPARRSTTTSIYLSREDDSILKADGLDSPSKSNKRRTLKSWRSWILQKIKNSIFVLFIATNITLSIWIVFMHGNIPEMFSMDSNAVIKSKRCHFPDIDPFSPDIKRLMKEPIRIDCTEAANPDFRRQIFFKTDRENNLVKIGDPGIPCCYRPFYRVNDEEVWIEPTRDHRYICHNLTSRLTPIPPEHEYIEVVCTSIRQSYRDGFFFIPRKPEADARAASILETHKKIAKNKNQPISETAQRLSVIILGIDSTSQLNFIRRMPQSLQFLQSSLNAVKLKGYNKVGENTLPNIVPLLTGLDLAEWKDACEKKNPTSNHAIHFDECPFIWKNFSSSGYHTSFAEDEVETSIFNLDYPRAFLHPPTDHYFRTFSFRMFHTQDSYEGLCQGTKLSFVNILENLKKQVVTYDLNKDLLFSMNWASKLSHDDFNRLGWGDKELLRTLEFLKQAGALEQSVLFLLGDHGSRNKEVRKTRQGQIEDRMPLAWISFPTWFPKKYPTAWKNLKKNTGALTSPFDVYETLKDLMDLTQVESTYGQYMRQAGIKIGARGGGKRQGISLFTAIPETRTCAGAGIPPHWCICYKKFPVSTKALDVQDAAGFIIRGLNNILTEYASKCERLKLRKVNSALKWHPDDKIEASYQGNGQEENYKRSSLLQIQFETKTNAASDAGEFEVTVLYDPDNGWRFTEQVVRLDKYEEHSYCMEKQEIKKICFCKQEKADLDGLHDFAF